MTQVKERTTALISSVGAGEGQPFQKNIVFSISDEPGKSNDPDESFLVMQREMFQMSDPTYLRTVTMSELYETVYPSRPPLIDGLLYPGTYLFVGAPKLGKSFFMAQIAYHVSMRFPLWGNSVRKGTVLYLALEDDYRRLQERLYRMFGTDSAEKLRFAISASNLVMGLTNSLIDLCRSTPIRT